MTDPNKSTSTSSSWDKLIAASRDKQASGSFKTHHQPPGSTKPSTRGHLTSLLSSYLQSVGDDENNNDDDDDDDMDPPQFPYKSKGTVEARLATEAHNNATINRGMQSIDLDPIIDKFSEDTDNFGKWATKEMEDRKLIEVEIDKKRIELRNTLEQLRTLERIKRTMETGPYRDAKSTLNKTLNGAVHDIRRHTKILGIRFAEGDAVIWGMNKNLYWQDVKAGYIEMRLYDLVPEMKPTPPPAIEPGNYSHPMHQPPEILGTPDHTYKGLNFYMTPEDHASVREVYKAAYQGNYIDHQAHSSEAKPHQSAPNFVPEWFYHLEQHSSVRFTTTGIANKWNEMKNRLHRLEKEKQQEDEEAGKAKWDEEWHEPDPGWAYAHHRQSGGWWKCRSTPDAPLAERSCKLCHRAPAAAAANNGRPAAEAYEGLMAIINRSMAAIAEEDKAVVLARMKAEDEEKK